MLEFEMNLPMARFSVATLVAGCCGFAMAHDLVGALTQERNGSSPAVALALEKAKADDATRAVLSNLRLWPVPRKVSICFVGGEQNLRRRVADAMRKHWPLGSLSEGRLDFDNVTFGQLPDCPASPSQDLRVAFKQGAGRWSYVGVDSRNYVPSMNLDRVETEPTEEFERIVAHEMGHALGLEHEHQSPAAPSSCGWNFQYIASAYLWPNPQAMRTNFDQFQSYIAEGKSAYVFTTYDRRSVMHYAFPAAAFISGVQSPCFIQPNFAPSDRDKNAIRIAYGSGTAAQQRSMKGSIPELLEQFNGTGFSTLQRVMSTKADLLK